MTDPLQIAESIAAIALFLNLILILILFLREAKRTHKTLRARAKHAQDEVDFLVGLIVKMGKQ